MANLRNGSKGGFEPGLTLLRVWHSTAEIPRSISGCMCLCFRMHVFAARQQLQTSINNTNQRHALTKVELRNQQSLHLRRLTVATGRYQFQFAKTGVPRITNVDRREPTVPCRGLTVITPSVTWTCQDYPTTATKSHGILMRSMVAAVQTRLTRQGRRTTIRQPHTIQH